MYPYDVRILAWSISIWNAVFLAAIVAGYFVFRRSVAGDPRVTFPLLRYLVVVYLSAIAAQIFAYAFDATGSLTPPPKVGAADYYLNPLRGPKTLYGVIVLLPLSVGLASFHSRVSLRRALYYFTPALFVVLAGARIGCFLQGCCYGMLSPSFGVSFKPGTPAHAQHFIAGLVDVQAASLPVVPTQLMEAVFLGAIALWSTRRAYNAEGDDVFLRSVVLYSGFRFVLEFLRADVDRAIYGPLATSQWIALLVIVFAASFTIAQNHWAASSAASRA